MRPIIIAGTAAVGLVALWVAILPLTSGPVNTRTAATSPAMNKALVFCRSHNGLEQACLGALARALVLDDGTAAPVSVGVRRCKADPRAFASVVRRD